MGSAILLQASRPLCLGTSLKIEAFLESPATSGTKKAQSWRDNSLALDTHKSIGKLPLPRSGSDALGSV